MISFMRKSRIKSRRRDVLKLTGGALLATGAAGCLGDDDDGDDDPGDDTGNGDDDPGDDSDDDDVTVEEWPEDGDVIDLIVAYGQGGGFDWYSRTFANYVPRYLDADVDIIVDNVTGAGGVIAQNQVFGAEPDGHTIMLRHGMASVQNQIARADEAEFDVAEYTNIGLCDMAVYAAIKHPDAPEIEDWDDVVEAAQTGLWGTPGAGVSGHVFAILIGVMNDAWEMDDVDFVHFDGIGEAMAAMDRDEIDYYVAALTSAIPYIEDGIAEGMFTLTQEGEPSLEDTPRLEEIDGVPNPDGPTNSIRTPRIWSAPPGLPDERAQVLADAFYEAGHDEDLIADAEEAGRTLDIRDREEADMFSSEMAQNWGEWEDLLVDLLN